MQKQAEELVKRLTRTTSQMRSEYAIPRQADATSGVRLIPTLRVGFLNG